MKKFLIDFIKIHPFLFVAVLISCILALISTIYSLINYLPKFWLYSIFFWLPVLLIILFQMGAHFLYKKFLWIARILTFVVNNFLLLLYIIFLFLSIWIISQENEAYMYNKPEYYQEVLKLFPSKYIIHFPKQIPSEATNVKMDADINHFFGSSILALKFTANEKYIQQELQKYNFIEKTKQNGEGMNNYAYGFIGYNVWDLTNHDFYVIQGRGYRRDNNMGIAVNPDFSEIVYYYSSPD